MFASRVLSSSIKVAATLIFAVLCITGCSTESPAVTFSVFGDVAEYQAYEELVAAFHEAHPEIRVALQHIPAQGDYRQRLATEFSAGTPPDVMLLNYRRFAQFAAQGALFPLTDYFEDSDLMAAEDFFPIAIDSFNYEEELWCIPQNISSLVVYYNKDMFDAAGIPYPADDWDRTDFVETARALTQDLDGDGRTDQYGVGLEPQVFRLAPFLWQDNAPLVDDPDNPTRLMLDNPASLATFQWFVDLQLVEGVVPDAVAESAESSESRFLNGRLGMMFESRRGVPTYRTISTFDWDVVPLPRGETAAGILHSDGYCMAEAAENKDEAWVFIEYANSEAGQRIVARSGRTVPSLLVVADSEDFLDPSLPPANSRIYVETASILGRVPVHPGWAGVEETANREIERAFYGQATVEEAAQAAIELTASFLEEEE
jgi:multiple sugar transport system substrate-binding protein